MKQDIPDYVALGSPNRSCTCSRSDGEKAIGRVSLSVFSEGLGFYFDKSDKLVIEILAGCGPLGHMGK